MLEWAMAHPNMTAFIVCFGLFVVGAIGTQWAEAYKERWKKGGSEVSGSGERGQDKH